MTLTVHTRTSLAPLTMESRLQIIEQEIIRILDMQHGITVHDLDHRLDELGLVGTTTAAFGEQVASVFNFVKPEIVSSVGGGTLKLLQHAIFERIGA